MSIEVNRRKEGTLIFKAGDQSSLDLSRQAHVNKLLCRLTVNHDNGASPTFLTDHFANLINSIQIVVNGRDWRKSIPMEKCIFNQMVLNQKSPTIDLKTTASTAGLVSTIDFTIDFDFRGTGLPHDGAEYSKVFNTFKLLVNWANAAACGTNITINSAELSVSSRQMVGLTIPSKDGFQLHTRNIETMLTKEVTATTTSMQIDLTPGKHYGRIWIVAKEAGNRVDTVVNNITLKSGQKVHMDLSAADIREEMKEFHRVHPTEDLSGIYLIDQLIRRKLSDALDTTINQHNTLELVLDVTKAAGTTTLTVFSDTVEQLKVKI